MALESTNDLPETVVLEVDAEDALLGNKPSESSMDTHGKRGLMRMEAVAVKHDWLREQALEMIDQDGIPQASKLVWVDQAEVYPACDSCFEAHRDAMWTGSTTRSDFEEFRSKMVDMVEEGTPCSYCKSSAIDDKREELEESIEFRFEFVNDDEGVMDDAEVLDGE